MRTKEEHEVNGEERPGADLLILMMTLRGIVARTSLQRGSVVIQVAALHQTPTGQRHACSRSTPNRNEDGPARTAVAHTANCWTRFRGVAACPLCLRLPPRTMNP